MTARTYTTAGGQNLGNAAEHVVDPAPDWFEHGVVGRVGEDRHVTEDGAEVARAFVGRWHGREHGAQMGGDVVEVVEPGDEPAAGGGEHQRRDQVLVGGPVDLGGQRRAGGRVVGANPAQRLAEAGGEDLGVLVLEGADRRLSVVGEREHVAEDADRPGGGGVGHRRPRHRTG